MKILDVVLHIHTEDGVFASPIPIEDNANNRIEHQMVEKDVQVVSLDLPLAVQDEISTSKRREIP